MSRIAKKLIILPEGVSIEQKTASLVVKGSKGEMEVPLHHTVKYLSSDEGHTFEAKHNAKIARAMTGTSMRLLQNAVIGVTEGFKKTLILNGVGYRMNLKGKQVELALGFSHPVVVDIPEGLSVEIDGQEMHVSGIDKQAVGQFAANIRSYRPVEPYKGKGFQYSDEQVRRKEGQKAVAAA